MDNLEFIKEIYKDVKNDPSGKKAIQNLSKSALVITETINTALLPLAAVNFAFNKAKDYFDKKFPQDIQNAAADIPVENIIEPKASIAGPVLQGLAFSNEEVPLREMYLKLLATSMDDRVATNAHPAFVEIIRQLNSEEASLLGNLIKVRPSIPIIELRQKVSGGYIPMEKHVLNLTNSNSNLPVELSNRAAIIDNWIRLGLVEVSYTSSLIEESLYGWVMERPEYKAIFSLLKEKDQELDYAKGLMTWTAFGKKFGEAVNII